MPVTLAEALAQLREAVEADFPGFAATGIRIDGSGGYPAIRLPLIPGPVAIPEPAAGGRGLSPTERKILEALAKSGATWLTGQQLADACGLPRSTSFTAILANLAEAGTVESSPRGYRLPPAK